MGDPRSSCYQPPCTVVQAIVWFIRRTRSRCHAQSSLATRKLLWYFPWHLQRLLFLVLHKMWSAEALALLGTISARLAGRFHPFAQLPITARLIL